MVGEFERVGGGTLDVGLLLILDTIEIGWLPGVSRTTSLSPQSTQTTLPSPKHELVTRTPTETTLSSVPVKSNDQDRLAIVEPPGKLELNNKISNAQPYTT